MNGLHGNEPYKMVKVVNFGTLKEKKQSQFFGMYLAKRDVPGVRFCLGARENEC